jgi:hypothetical protein
VNVGLHLHKWSKVLSSENCQTFHSTTVQLQLNYISLFNKDWKWLHEGIQISALKSILLRVWAPNSKPNVCVSLLLLTNLHLIYCSVSVYVSESVNTLLDFRKVKTTKHMVKNKPIKHKHFCKNTTCVCIWILRSTHLKYLWRYDCFNLLNNNYGEIN